MLTLLVFPSDYRSSSLSLSPAQQRRENNYFRTPPVSRGRHKIATNLMDGSRVAGHVYKHLQEDESTDIESIRRWSSFCILLVLSCLFDPRGGNSLCPPLTLRSNSRLTDTDPRTSVTEVKLEWQKDNFWRNEFMTEMLSVQVREQAYEIWSGEINEICCALLQLGLSQLIWRADLILTAQQYHGAGEVQDTSLCVILHALATGLLLWMKMCFTSVVLSGLKIQQRRQS